MKIQVIPATRSGEGKGSDYTGAGDGPRRKKVAAYCRVSTDMEEQESSYEMQAKHYLEYIRSRPDWTFAGIYADEGLSGTDTRKRDQFNRMIEACMDGQIDLILTKSISRFARNTLDCLKYIRLLKEKNIGIFFEKENIDTLDSKGELLITIMASIAQQESQSISQNVRMGIQYQFQQGKVRLNHTNFYGYTKDEKGDLVVVPEEAEIIRLIFDEFLEGKSESQIAEMLEERGIITVTGNKKWHTSTINSILKNEKYMGDLLLQKYYTSDYLSKRKMANRGQFPQYYVENNHEPIVARDVFMAAQGELYRRAHLVSAKGEPMRYSRKFAFSGIVRCGICGNTYRHIGGSRTRRSAWSCGSRVKNMDNCPAPVLKEQFLQNKVREAFLSMLSNAPRIYSIFKGLRDKEIPAYWDQIEVLSRKISELRQQISALDPGDPDLQEDLGDLEKVKSERQELLGKNAEALFKCRQMKKILGLYRHESDLKLTHQYDDEEMKYFLERIDVMEDHLLITFKTGLTFRADL